MARALIANTYAFSVESEMSPFHRVLIRADSATLPSADSPYSTAPDMPPIPSNAEEVYVPPLVSRTEDPSQKKMESLSAREPLASPISVSSPGMSDVLDYYESSVDRERSPALSSAGFKPAFTPITEESPQASTYSPSVSSKITQKELSLGYNSPSTGSGNSTSPTPSFSIADSIIAPINWSNFRRASHSKREASIDGRTAALFPIGARAASIPVRAVFQSRWFGTYAACISRLRQVYSLLQLQVPTAHQMLLDHRRSLLSPGLYSTGNDPVAHPVQFKLYGIRGTQSRIT